MHYCQCHWRVQSWRYLKLRLCCPVAWLEQFSVAGGGATEAPQSSPEVGATTPERRSGPLAQTLQLSQSPLGRKDGLTADGHTSPSSYLQPNLQRHQPHLWPASRGMGQRCRGMSHPKQGLDHTSRVLLLNHLRIENWGLKPWELALWNMMVRMTVADRTCSWSTLHFIVRLRACRSQRSTQLWYSGGFCGDAYMRGMQTTTDAHVWK